MSETIVVLQDEGILAVSGKEGQTPKIEKVVHMDTEGFEDPMTQWRKVLEAYAWQQHPGPVKLVLPAAYSSTRISQIPYAKGKQLDKMAEQVKKENFSEDIADYCVIHADRKNGTSLCCGGAERDVLQQFQEIFKELKIELKAVTVPMEGYLRVLESIKEYRGKTAIYLFFEESSVTSILYKEGIYHYSTRSRIFSERGTLDFGTEIVRSISGMLQFYSTAKTGIPITDVYYAGCSEDDFEVCEEGLRNMNLEIHAMRDQLKIDAEGGAEYCLSGIGALMTDKNKNSIDLLKVWAKEKNEETKAEVHFGKDLFFPVLTFAICMVVFAGVSVWNLKLSGDISDIQDWINNSAVQSQYQAAKQVKEQSDLLVNAQSQVEEMKKNLATFPDLNEEKVSAIVDVGGSDMNVRIKTLDAESGTLTFNAISKKVIDIPGYISKLQKTGLFSSVNYTGYKYEDEEYSLELSCVLKGEETGGENE